MMALSRDMYNSYAGDVNNIEVPVFSNSNITRNKGVKNPQIRNRPRFAKENKEYQKSHHLLVQRHIIKGIDVDKYG